MALLFPLIVIPVYIPVETTSIALPETEYFTENTTQFAMHTSAQQMQWTDVIPVVYGIGLAIFLIQFLFQFGSLLLLVLRNPKNKDGIYTYVTVNYNISPFSFFKWIVYNPNTFQDDELELILTHEKVHASQLHSIDILVTQLACAVFWFNPLMWLYRKAVRQNLEYIADFTTQKTSNKDRTYQHLLLKTTVANHHISLSNNFYNSLIKERIVMLKKSRSNKRKQWRYLLVLPLLALLLLSMNTKEVFVESNSNAEKTDHKLEFIVTKNTTDSELKSMSDAVKQKGGHLTFSDVKRNESNELTHIFVKLYNHSYGSSNSSKAIKAFIIYKELSGLKGGYVGRLGNGTTHFGSDLKKILTKENESQVKAFQKRVESAVIKNGLFNDEDKKRRSEAETIEIHINKNTTNEDLKNIKKELKNEGISFKYSNVKRNSDGEITGINTEFKSDENSSNYNISGDDGIKPFRFKSSDGTFNVGTVNKNTLEYRIKNGPTKIQSANGTSKVIVIDENNVKDTLYINTQTMKHNNSVFIQKQNKFTFSTDDKDSNIFINDTETPLFIINGNKVDKLLFENINSDKIQSVFVFKGEEAQKKYGDEGKNGVIIINTEKETKTVIGDHNVMFFETENDGPWKIDTSVTSVQFYDDEGTTLGMEFVITKDVSDQFLEKLKNDFKSYDIDARFSKVKRNKKGEITSIKISLDDNNGRESSASWKEKDQAIPDIVMGKSKDDKLFIRAIGN
ncbi:M56 family metallopeptidase [Psychroserpens mesophilus]|uniref:M56 family metallopeptidase n=1 Tax=Psychroserpens mesophilus TaxID=325473 RepID=UPI003D64EEE9